MGVRYIIDKHSNNYTHNGRLSDNFLPINELRYVQIASTFLFKFVTSAF